VRLAAPTKTAGAASGALRVETKRFAGRFARAIHRKAYSRPRDPKGINLGDIAGDFSSSN